jgi:hypothetical protein
MSPTTGLVAALALLLPAAPEPLPARRIALVVGLDRTEDSTWPPLRFAEKDAADVSRALSPSFDHIIALSGAADRPTHARVLAAFDELEALDVNPSDTVVVYFSLHGTLAYDAVGVIHRVLVLADTRADRAIETGLSHELLVERLDRLRSVKKLAVIASCHSGAGKSELPASVRNALKGLKGGFFAEPEAPGAEGRIILAASAWGEPAREDDALQNDIYTHFFLEALKGFDLNQDGATTALEAHEYARRRTIEYTHGRQRPSLDAQIVGDDPIVLAGERRRTGQPLLASWASAFAGGLLEIDGRTKGALPGSYALDAGTHRVRVTRPGEAGLLLDREVELDPGGLVVLERLGPEAPARSLLEASASGIYRATLDRATARDYLPSHWGGGGTLSLWLRRDLALSLAVAGGAANSQVALHDPLSGTFLAAASLTFVDLELRGRYVVAELGPLSLGPELSLGGSWAERRFQLATLASPDQSIVAPLAGAGLEVSCALLPVLGVAIGAELDASLVRIESRLRVVPSALASARLWVRP